MRTPAPSSQGFESCLESLCINKPSAHEQVSKSPAPGSSKSRDTCDCGGGVFCLRVGGQTSRAWGSEAGGSVILGIGQRTNGWIGALRREGRAGEEGSGGFGVGRAMGICQAEGCKLRGMNRALVGSDIRCTTVLMSATYTFEMSFLF